MLKIDRQKHLEEEPSYVWKHLNFHNESKALIAVKKPFEEI